ncbi:type VI secretion system protein TssL, long form, partial [Propylenella binzhouense]
PGGAPPRPQAPAADWLGGSPGAQGFFPEIRAPAGPAQPDTPKIPLEVALNAPDAAEFGSANPITAAAAPILILLGRLRLLIIDMQAVPLMHHVAGAIERAERAMLGAGVDAEDVRIAKYVLCATADDIVQNLPGGDRHVWMQYSMLARFFHVRTSGIGFFEELKKVLANPAPHYDLLELMHACLSLGFEGQFRGAAGGDIELQRVRRDVYQTLRHMRSRLDDDISPHWQGMAVAQKDAGTRIPIWAIASGAALLLLAAFFLLRILLSSDGERISDELLALNQGGPISIARAAFAPLKDPVDFNNTTQIQRIRAALSDEIAAGGVDVEAVGEEIVVRVNNLVLFGLGAAEVQPEFEPIAKKIAAALEPEPGPINIIGHTDNVKVRPTGRFKSNYDLSVARAKSVETIFEKNISDPSRLQVAGRGEQEPIATNDTKEGRAQNRRVEIMIPREETL